MILKKGRTSSRVFVKTLPKTIANIEDGKQVIKASGSVGAIYIEANEALSKKDFTLCLGVWQFILRLRRIRFSVSVIEYLNLRFIWNLMLGIWNLIA